MVPYRQVHAFLIFMKTNMNSVMLIAVLQCSLVSASGLEGWLEDQGPGAVMTVDTLRQFEALSTTSTKEVSPLLHYLSV